MRIHASHIDAPNYQVFLDGSPLGFVWWADEETGEVEVYKRTDKVVGEGRFASVLLEVDSDGNPVKEILKGVVEIRKR